MKLHATLTFFTAAALLTGALLLLAGCEKENKNKTNSTPQEQGGGNSLPMEVFVSTEPQSTNVLIEGLTGLGCKFCPEGHRLCDELAEEYPGKLFVINVHTGLYAEGKNPDYTTDEGYTLLRTLGAEGFPSAYVNRYAWKSGGSANSTYFVGRGVFRSCAEQLMNKDLPAMANIAAKATLNKSTKKLKITTQICFTRTPDHDTATAYVLNVALVQNNIKGPQQGAESGYPALWDGTNYTHNHMLRAYINGLKGETIEYKGTGKEHVIQKVFSYPIPAKLGKGNIPVVPEDLEVICYVSRKGTAAGNPEEYFPIEIINVCKCEITE